jgi:N4-(beta-N-acetylglucosaminyl)-L-asparaginase
MIFWTRRRFFLSTLAGGLAASARSVLGHGAERQDGSKPGGAGQAKAAAPAEKQAAPAAQGVKPLMVSSSNGLSALTLGMGMLKRGADTLDAVIATVNVQEDDPRDTSVGYGGLPNEAGEVELDASVMHGPTRRAGAVASLRHIKNPSRVAKLVMERSDHVLLVGEGALRFAEAHGFERMNLLTDDSRRRWLLWKESMSDRDAWGPGLDSPEWKERALSLAPEHLAGEERAQWAQSAWEDVLRPPTGTINCLALSEKGDISGCTTTSGLAWKIPGRVGDSPIIGAGLYVDNDVGAAGSTGRGEENIKVSGAHTIVEMMRKGVHPREACLEACARIARNFNKDKTRLMRFNINFYALNKDGQHGGAVLWTRQGQRRSRYAVHDGTEPKLVEAAALFDADSDW